MTDKMSNQSICQECAFCIQMECTHPDESEVNCTTVSFCNSFTPAVEVDSPCVTFGEES